MQLWVSSGQEFALISLDIEKAFDSIDWQFMKLTLCNYGFPPGFLRWIEVIQNNVELMVSNNGHLSEKIRAVKGVAQGDSLSPYLFILMIETLAIHFRNNSKLVGMKFLDMEKIVSMVAVDSLLMVQCTQRNLELIHLTLQQFQWVTGLNINFDNTVFIPPTKNPPGLLCNVFQDIKSCIMAKYFNIWEPSFQQILIRKILSS